MNKCIQCANPIHEALSIFNFYKPSQQFCETCEKQWQSIKLDTNDKRCIRCLNFKTKASDECLDCKFLNQQFTLMSQLYCDYKYDGIMKETIHHYKFMKDCYLAEVLASKLTLPKTSYDYIVPIPSPYKRDEARTFNPVTTVLDKMGVDYLDVLGTHSRPKQSKLGKRERFKADNPFYLKEKIDITNKDILLVDDIYTTGLTVHYAGSVLCNKNARKFKVFAFSR